MVCYRWHPWHGRAVLIRSAVIKGEQAVYRCTLEAGHDHRPLETPQWMLDAAACCRIELSAVPIVTIQALRELGELLAAARRVQACAVLQAEHLDRPDPGGARATQQSPALVQPDELVSPASNDATVDRLARRRATTDAVAAGAIAAPASPRSSHGTRRSGGVR